MSTPTQTEVIRVPHTIAWQGGLNDGAVVEAPAHIADDLTQRHVTVTTTAVYDRGTKRVVKDAKVITPPLRLQPAPAPAPEQRRKRVNPGKKKAA